MKKSILASTVAAAAILFTSCNTNEGEAQNQSQPASMTITITGAEGAAPLSRGNGTPTQAAENTVKDYTVYVFNASTDKLQKSQSFTSGLTNTVTGLTIGPKKIVVLANVAELALPDLQPGDDYSILSNISHRIALSTQVPDNVATQGLVMSGSTSTFLSAGANTLASNLKISRIVGKVKLGTITVAPEPGHEGEFIIVAVHIMKAREKGSVGVPTVLTNNNFLGGRTGMLSTEASFLTEDISIGDHANRYFYVFPNDNTDDNATLLTLEAAYEGRTVYFPVRINDGTGTGTTNGSFIQRNGSYVLNLTIKRPGDGSNNPEQPVDPATLAITVEVEDWASELVQNIEI